MSNGLTAITITADGPTRFEASRLVARTAHEVVDGSDKRVLMLQNHDHQVRLDGHTMASEVTIALAGSRADRSELAAGIVGELQALSPYYALTFSVNHNTSSYADRHFAPAAERLPAAVQGIA